MHIHFFATLRQIVGGKTVELTVADGLTVRALIAALVTRWPPLGPQLLDEQGELFRHVHVLINGRDAPYLPAGLETQVSAADTVNIFPAVAGGAADTVAHAVMLITGIPHWRLQDYLVAMGAGEGAEGWLCGPGWQARLTPADDFVIGSVRVGRVRLELCGGADAVEAVRRALAPKLLRGGG